MGEIEWTETERRAMGGEIVGSLETAPAGIPWEEYLADAVLRSFVVRDHIAAREAAAEKRGRVAALRDAAEQDTVLIPDALGYKVQAVFTESLLDRADAEAGGRS